MTNAGSTRSPAWRPRCKLVSLKVLDDEGNGQASNLIAAIEQIQEINGYGRRISIHGVNMSVGYDFEPEWFACGQSPLCVEVDRLVQLGRRRRRRGGKHGLRLRTATRSAARSPPGMDLTINDPGNAELAITVGSTHRDMPHMYGVSYFSSKGPTGDGRLEAGPRRARARRSSRAPPAQACAARRPDSDPNTRRTCDYVEDSGTSMAAPHVSGVIAAFLSVRREFIGQPEEVKEIFLSTATDLRRDRYFQGNGLVDLMRAIQSVDTSENREHGRHRRLSVLRDRNSTEDRRQVDSTAGTQPQALLAFAARRRLDAISSSSPTAGTTTWTKRASSTRTSSAQSAHVMKMARSRAREAQVGLPGRALAVEEVRREGPDPGRRARASAVTEAAALSKSSTTAKVVFSSAAERSSTRRTRCSRSSKRTPRRARISSRSCAGLVKPAHADLEDGSNAFFTRNGQVDGEVLQARSRRAAGEERQVGRSRGDRQARARHGSAWRAGPGHRRNRSAASRASARATCSTTRRTTR